MDTSSSQSAFCLQTSRLDDEELQTSRHCQLMIHFAQTIYLQLSGCVFNNQDQNSTIITSKFPNIFIDKIINDTFASGRVFQEAMIHNIKVNQWNLINIQVCFIRNKCPAF
jgi:hypothetical protein